MTFCPACQVDVHPFQEMQSDMRMLDRCPRCQAGLPKNAAPAPAQNEVAPPKPHAAKPAQRSGDIVEQIRAELAEVEAAIVDQTNLRARRSMLRRMLAVAEKRMTRTRKLRVITSAAE